MKLFAERSAIEDVFYIFPSHLFDISNINMNNKSFMKSLSGFLAVSVSSIFWCVIALLVTTSCSKDNDPNSPDNEPNIPDYEQIVHEGMEMYTRAYADGELIEEVIDEVKNLGTTEKPTLFHVNKSHKLKGNDVPPGTADLKCAFMSLTQEEYEGFIRIFAVMYGLAETDQLTDDQKKEAFTKLFSFLKQYDIELPLLVYISGGNIEELRAASKIIRVGYTRSEDSGMDNNDKLRFMLKNGIIPSQVLAEKELAETRSSEDYEPCRLVIDGKAYTITQKFRIVQDAKKLPECDRIFASNLNVKDLDLSHYVNSSEMVSPSYEVTYGSKLIPMTHIKFHVGVKYNSRCTTQPGTYVEKIQVVIEESRRTPGMLCNATVWYHTPYTYGSNENLEPCSSNEVRLLYGDKACINFGGRLVFIVWGKDGFDERYMDHWKDLDA